MGGGGKRKREGGGGRCEKGETKHLSNVVVVVASSSICPFLTFPPSRKLNLPRENGKREREREKGLFPPPSV